ncbi:molecular chaperone [Pseudomonas sp. TNT2022 ID233]|uniref:fimbrial biogenesis chaperone n=1 Tax=Pseudomonas aphyarum TaxID=2942629 RepID=UPI00235EB66D|nr:molecular chaperone [Pseudomonas aphyarum]MDD1141016.1 molecular chaperone [Pseudomonas aphyarum]
MFVLRYYLIIATSIFSNICLAGIQVGGTRIIFPASDREATVQVRNEGTEDIMVQSWIEAESSQLENELPFAITPSLARLSYKKQQALRIFYQGKGLPLDRESVFWLSVQEIPQLSKSDNTLQVAFRQRLKVFYRPSNLPGTPDEAAENLSWNLVSVSGRPMAVANNTSPFHISLGGVSVLVSGKEYTVEEKMVNPYSSSSMNIKGLLEKPEKVAEVKWESINDYGALVKHHSVTHP